jgi:hypothetical protein
METDDDVDVGVENEVNMEGMNDMRKRKWVWKSWL